MYLIEKSKEGILDPCKLRSRNFSITLEEFFGQNVIDFTIA